jgi:X-Pro dipeptidyl-peptidase (S15 family)
MNILIEKNIMVPMRDGVRLATDVYRPAEGGPVPVLLSRLPYNKELPMMIQAAIDALRAVQVGYAVVLQDCRGRFGSEGEFTALFNEASDGADTVDWIAQQPCELSPLSSRPRTIIILRIVIRAACSSSGARSSGRWGWCRRNCNGNYGRARPAWNRWAHSCR